MADPRGLKEKTMWDIKFYSRGGQGAVTAAKILVDAALIDGKYAQAIPAYGQERKGAPVYTYARIGDEPIEVKCYVYRPNCVLVFDLGLPDIGIDLYEGIVPGTIMIANSLSPDCLAPHLSIAQVATVPANDITKEILGNVPANVAMLGAFAKATGAVSLEALETAIKHKISGKGGELNAKACRRAFEETRVHAKA